MENEQSLNPKEVYGPFLGNRWVQLISAVVAMIMIANLQYAWTLFTTPLKAELGTTLPAIQYAFTLFIMFETFVQPVGGFLLDKFGSRLMFTVAGIFVGLGWSMMGQVHSLGALYFFYAMAGTGAAIIYGGSISVSIRWFSDRKGLATGLIAAGFGMGALPFIPVIGSLLKGSGVASAFMSTGIFQGAIVLIVAQILRYPPSYLESLKSKKEKSTKVVMTEKDFRPTETLRTPHFWLIWLMFISINVGGLIITAQTKPFGKHIGITAAAILIAVSAQNLGNGLGRFGWGWISDRLGRYRTMFIAFLVNSILLFFLPILGHNDGMYIVLTALIMLTWGEIFALFPAVNADLFGTAYAATNYGFLYSAKGFASIFAGGLAAWLATHYNWQVVFTAAAFFSLFASIMSLVVPKLPKPTHPGIPRETDASHTA